MAINVKYTWPTRRNAKGNPVHKVFITYHHANDWWYKDELLRIHERHAVFIDKSVHVGDISPHLPDQTIRRAIRDQYLRDSTVTILLVGTATWGRKHVDWELYSSMIDGAVNKRSGILVVTLPSTGDTVFCITAHAGEKQAVYPDYSWNTAPFSRADYEQSYPCMPTRIIDNLVAPQAYVSVAPWDRAKDPANLRFLIDAAFSDRTRCDYDFSTPMRRRNASQ